MAGRKHHHLWQMLQKGFSWEEHNDQHVWVYSKVEKPRRTVTRKYGRINGFYGPENSEADENITTFENSIQEFIHSARGSAHGVALDGELAGSFVAHLEMRSLFLRSEMSNIASRIAGILRTTLQKKSKSGQIVNNFLKNHPELIEEQLDELGMFGTERHAAREMISSSLPQLADQAGEELRLMGQELFGLLENIIPKVAEKAHNKALCN